MPTEIGHQLPRFAEALDREAPPISIDEILNRGAVAVDVDHLARPAWDQVPRLAVVSWGDATTIHGENGEHDTSIEIVRTAAEPPTRRRVALKIALAAAAAAVLVVALASIVRTGDEPDPADVPTSTIPTPPTTIPVGPFVGVWLSTDADGSSQTMEIARSGTDDYEVVIRDQAATVACAGGASTLTGAGRLATDTSLVIAQPELTCDDGTIPPIGPAPQAELANFTLDLDTATGELGDNFGIVWQREGSNVDLNGPTTSGGMWPQSTLEEVRAAQELADAGDPGYTWQVGAQLTEDDPFAHVDELELVDRFIREVLGWEAYLFNGWEGGDFNASIGGTDGWVDGALTDQRFLRCAPGRTNPLYAPQPDSEQPGDSCAPTLDDLRYESVSVDLAQLARQDRDAIWVVNRWRLTAPFAQANPVDAEAQATERLEAFLAARVTGTGAEGHVQVDPDIDVPLLYATTSGAPYERYEIERVDGPQWPAGDMTFSARLFADGDATVVEQEIRWYHSGGLWLDANATTENGRPVVLSYTSSDGEVTVSAPSTWETWLPGKGAGKGGHEQALDVWFGGLWHPEDFFGNGERIELVDPAAYDAWCAANGGSPLLSAPADAAAIAQQLIADPNFETTAPVAARVGGVEAVSIDVALAPGGRACGIGMIEISRWIHGLEPGWRLRLYLVDLPEGMSVQTLAITVVAPEERFAEVIAETAPIIDSIEFHPRAP
jgi:hypothetical protein